MNIIKDLIKKPHVRIILLHPPYTEAQQSIIDSISRQSKHIIGQLERKPPLKYAAEEIQRLILSHKDPFIAADELQYVILGRQKPNKYEKKIKSRDKRLRITVILEEIKAN